MVDILNVESGRITANVFLGDGLGGYTETPQAYGPRGSRCFAELVVLSGDSASVRALITVARTLKPTNLPVTTESIPESVEPWIRQLYIDSKTQ